jgi:hypothetical protein
MTTKASTRAPLRGHPRMAGGVAAVLLAVTLPSAPAFAGGEPIDTLSVVESQGLLGQAGALPHVTQEAQQPTPVSARRSNRASRRLSASRSLR